MMLLIMAGIVVVSVLVLRHRRRRHGAQYLLLREGMANPGSDGKWKCPEGKGWGWGPEGKGKCCDKGTNKNCVSPGKQGTGDGKMKCPDGKGWGWGPEGEGKCCDKGTNKNCAAPIKEDGYDVPTRLQNGKCPPGTAKDGSKCTMYSSNQYEEWFDKFYVRKAPNGACPLGSTSEYRWANGQKDETRCQVTEQEARYQAS